MSDLTPNDNWVETIIQSCLSRLSPSATALIVILALVLGLLPENKLSSCDVIVNPSTPSQLPPQHNSRVDYERLKLEMTLVEVESILGRGVEIEREQDTATFVWKNCDGSLITVVFQDEKLKRKHQLNLQ